MSRYCIKPAAPDPHGVVLDITPRSAGWRYVGFRLVQLSSGQVFSGREMGRECCIVVLSGTASVSVGDEVFAAIGGRSSVFDDVPPGAVYVPQNTSYRISAENNAEIALCTAPGADGFPARRITEVDQTHIVRGEGTNMRYVRNILSETDPANALLVVEVITPAGHWSSYPPHKHDTATADETALEETYYHRLNPPQGFALQRIYTDDRSIDETVCVEDRNVVIVPRGYHPIGSPFGYDLYYLNVMAGVDRHWKFHNDPAHEWMLRPNLK